MITPPPTIRLSQLAHARSGDKGNHANIGVIANSDEAYAFLGQYLTESRVAEFLLPLRPREVERFSLPGIRAYNFLIRNVLAGGGSRSLRIDSQGKTLALALLNMEIPVPENFGRPEDPGPKHPREPKDSGAKNTASKIRKPEPGTTRSPSAEENQ